VTPTSNSFLGIRTRKEGSRRSEKESKETSILGVPEARQAEKGRRGGID